jgi:hypothetical protein
MWPLLLAVSAMGLFWCLFLFLEYCGSYGNECNLTSQRFIGIIAFIFFLIGALGLVCSLFWLYAHIKQRFSKR